MDIKKTSEYIDLNLPSETLWKTHNEDGFFTYDDAIKTFGDTLPTDEQFQELIEECEWKWDGWFYSITGTNNNKIILPAAGFKKDSDEINGVGYNGEYWTSRNIDSDDAFCLFFTPLYITIESAERNFKKSVRLVKNNK